jgi:predicted DNA-binding WGR domain protein
MTRTFEYVAGSSAKFWQVTTKEQTCTVRFGKLGTQGQTLIKTFPDSSAAQRHADKLVTEKTRKGYVECATA